MFFNRTHTNQKQPNLVDLFTAAIRDLTYKQTAAFDQFLIYTHLASRDYKRQRYVSSDNSTQNHLLNINPEGELLKEIKDIMDELHIMMRIKEQQQTVMEGFVKHIRRTMMPLVRAQQPTSLTSSAWEAASAVPIGSVSPYSDESGRRPERQREQQRENAEQTLNGADNLLLDLQERIAELRALLQSAQNTSAAVRRPPAPLIYPIISPHSPQPTTPPSSPPNPPTKSYR